MKKIFIIVMSLGFILAGLMGTSAAQTQEVLSPREPSTGIEPIFVNTDSTTFNTGNPSSNFIPLGLCNALYTACSNGDYSMAPQENPSSEMDCADLYDRCVDAAGTNTTQQE